MQSLSLIALPAFADNYIWMLHDGAQAVVVDPGDAKPVHDALDKARLRLAGILVTHHHDDHVGGVEDLMSRLEGDVHGPADEPIPQPFVERRDGDAIEYLGLRFEVLSVPGHTRGHIAYFAEPAAQAPLLFCGDTLFSGGCGRLFEGTPVQMHASLQRLAALPGSTRVCCAHEYTLGNLRFAHAVEPGNVALGRYHDWCQTQRARNLPTLPSSMATERAINPFLRCSEASVIDAAMAHGAASTRGQDVFAALRAWKNTYR